MSTPSKVFQWASAPPSISFLDLPAELRSLVYDNIVPERIKIDGYGYVFYYYAPHPIAKKDWRDVHHRSQLRSQKKPDFQLACTAFMQSCRQVADEMRPHLDRCTVWCPSPGTWAARRWIAKRNDSCLARLPKIEILPYGIDSIFTRSIMGEESTFPYWIPCCHIFTTPISVVLPGENDIIWPPIRWQLHTPGRKFEPHGRFEHGWYRVAAMQRSLENVEAGLIASQKSGVTRRYLLEQIIGDVDFR